MKKILYSVLLGFLTMTNISLAKAKDIFVKEPVDYVTPYIGNISHLHPFK